MKNYFFNIRSGLYFSITLTLFANKKKCFTLTLIFSPRVASDCLYMLYRLVPGSYLAKRNTYIVNKIVEIKLTLIKRHVCLLMDMFQLRFLVQHNKKYLYVYIIYIYNFFLEFYYKFL